MKHKVHLVNSNPAETLSLNKTHLMTQYLYIKNKMQIKSSLTIDVITYSPKS